MGKICLIWLVTAGLITGCEQAGKNQVISAQEETEMRFGSNGEKIYFTNISETTGRIAFGRGPSWLGEYGGSCGGCHGPDGKGGIPALEIDVQVPDISYRALMLEEHVHGDKKETHRRYTDELIKRSITQGLDAGGRTLDNSMPRYEMTENDLDDLIEFMKTLE